MTLSLPEIIRVLLPNGAVKKLPLEEYVRGVVTAALPADAPLEAMKAQAVAARTFGASTRRHIERGADVCTLRHCQVWKEAASAAAGRAAGATRGIVALHNGRLIDAYYFDHCDGNTRDATGMLIQAPSYLHSVACACGFATLKGHGIGMCQRGALVMARFGDTFEVILKHYYTGIMLERAGVMPTAPTPVTRPLASQKSPTDFTDSRGDQGSTAESKIPSVAPAMSRGIGEIEGEVARGDLGPGTVQEGAESRRGGKREAAETAQQSGPSEEAGTRVESVEQSTETTVVHLPLTPELEAPPPAQVLEAAPAPVVELHPAPVEETLPAPVVELLPELVEEPPTAPVVEGPPMPIAELPPAPSTRVQASKSKATKRAAKTRKPARTTKPRRSKKTTSTPRRAPRQHGKGKKKEPGTSLETPAEVEEATTAGQVAETPEAPATRFETVLPISPAEASAVGKLSEPAGAATLPPSPDAVVMTGEFSWYPVAEEVTSEADKLEAEMLDETLDALAAIIPPVEDLGRLPPAPETMPEEMPFFAVAEVPEELPTPVPPPPLLEEEFGEAPSTGPVPEVLIDHLPGPRMIAGDLSKPGIIITIRDADGHAVVTVSGAAPHHGAGGFEAPLAGDGTYAVSFNHHALQVNLEDETVFICCTA